MKLNKVCIGFTKDGREHLFYKRYAEYSNGVGYTEFVDLETKEKFEISQIDVDTLKPFKKVISTYYQTKKMFKRRIIKFYQADRNKMIELKKLFYGDLVVGVRTNNMSEGDSNYIMRDQVEFETMSKNILFESLNDYRSLKLDDGKDYHYLHKLDSVVLGWELVDNIRLFESDDKYASEMPKRKILEMDYRKEL